MTNSNTYAQLDAWIDAHFDEQVKFLQALIRVPTDTPPGNNAPHAERTAELLQEFGFETVLELSKDSFLSAVSELDTPGLKPFDNGSQYLTAARKQGNW